MQTTTSQDSKTQDELWFEVHEGHIVDAHLRIAYCATCDVFYTLARSDWLGSTR